MGGGSGGGGNSTTVQKADPWVGQQPYLYDVFNSAQGVYKNPQQYPQYYQGDTVANMDPLQQQGIQGQANWATQQFPQLFNPFAGSTQNLMAGNTGSTGFANGVSSSVLPALTDTLSKTPTSQIGNQQLDLSRFMPNVNTNPITADPNAAIGSMLSGQVNTQGLGAAYDAATQPMINQFNRQIMPALRSEEILTGQLGGSRGDIAQGLAASDLTQQLSNVAGTMGYNAYQDAQARQGQGAQLATNALLNQSGLGLQGYQTAGNLAGTQAGLNLQSDVARAGDKQSQVNALLGGGNLAQNALAGVDTNMFRGASLYPSVLQASQMPFQAQQQAGAQLQGQNQNEINADISKWDYGQQLPMNMLDWYSSLVQGNNWGGSTTGTQKTNTSSNPITGALGGAATGYGLAAMAGMSNPWTAALMGGMALMGAM